MPCEGVDVLLLVSGAESTDRAAQHAAAVRAARDAGVERVVCTSLHAAAPDCTFTLGRDHHATEELIREAGLVHVPARLPPPSTSSRCSRARLVSCAVRPVTLRRETTSRRS